MPQSSHACTTFSVLPSVACTMPCLLAMCLVVCHFEFDGYRRWSFSRAFVVVKRHVMVAWAALRMSAYAVISWISVASSGIRRARHWRGKRLNAIAAILNQLPCLGVECHARFCKMRRALAGAKAAESDAGVWVW